jgi:hypothetical protein
MLNGMSLKVSFSNSELDNRKVEIAARINVEGDAKKGRRCVGR